MTQPASLVGVPCQPAKQPKLARHATTTVRVFWSVVLLAGGTLATSCGSAGAPARPTDADSSRAAPEDPTRTVTPVVEALPDGIIIDRQAMSDASCHKMGKTIMGRCSPADIDRLAEEIRLVARAEAAVTPDPAAEEVVLRLSEFKFESSAPLFHVDTPYRFVIQNTGVLSHEVVMLPSKGKEIAHDDEGQAAHSHDDTASDEQSTSLTNTTAGANIVVVDGQVMDHTGAVLEVSRHDLPPGATVIKYVTFTDAGRYEFQCHVPGHQLAGMELDVEIRP